MPVYFYITLTRYLCFVVSLLHSAICFQQLCASIFNSLPQFTHCSELPRFLLYWPAKPFGKGTWGSYQCHMLLQQLSLRHQCWESAKIHVHVEQACLQIESACPWSRRHSHQQWLEPWHCDREHSDCMLASLCWHLCKKSPSELGGTQMDSTHMYGTWQFCRCSSSPAHWKAKVRTLD